MPPSEGGVRARSGPTRATPVALLALAGALLALRVALGVLEHRRPAARADRLERPERAAVAASDADGAGVVGRRRPAAR